MNAKLIASALVVLMMVGASMAAPEYCALEAKVGICQGSIDRFYYNPESGQCVVFQYGGCQGNENNFETEALCLAACAV